MSDDRKLNVPKPRRTRNVTGFGAPAAQPPAPPAEKAAESRSSRRSTKPAKPKRPAAKTRTTSPPRTDDNEMVRIHATVSPLVADALRRRVEGTGDTHTEVLAEAFVAHGSELSAGDPAEHAKYEAAGFRPKRPKQPRGRMTATFYVSTKARRTLDEAAAAGHFSSRSAYIDALLRKGLDVEEGGR